MPTFEIFHCDICPKSFSIRKLYNQHLRTHSKPLPCKICSRRFALRSDLDRHNKSQHLVGQKRYACTIRGCRKEFTRKDNLLRHLRREHGTKVSELNQREVPQGRRKGSSGPRESFSTGISTEDHGGQFLVSLLMKGAIHGNLSLLKSSLEYGVDPNCRAEDGSTALYYAARGGQLATVQYLLHCGADISLRGEHDRSVLQGAISSGQLAVVNAIMTALPADQRFSPRDYHLPAQGDFFIRSESHEVLRWYLDQCNFREADFTIFRILKSIIRHGNLPMLNTLLSHPKFEKGSINAYILHFAAMNGCEDTLNMLLAHTHIDVDTQFRCQLYHASRSGNVNMVKMVLGQSNNYINPSDHYNSTPLHVAAARGQTKVVQLFLARDDVKVFCKDVWGRTPLHLAASNGKTDVVILLLGHILSLAQVRDNSGWLPLHSAAFHGHFSTAQILLEGGPVSPGIEVGSENVRTLDPVTKSEIAAKLLSDRSFMNEDQEHGVLYLSRIFSKKAQSGDIHTLKLLLAHPDLKINAIDGLSTYTALMWVVKKGQIDAIRLLLRHPDIDVNFSCRLRRLRRTALTIAKQQGNQEIIDLLVAHGAIDVDESTSTAKINASTNDKTTSTNELPAPFTCNSISPIPAILIPPAFDNNFRYFNPDEDLDDLDFDSDFATYEGPYEVLPDLPHHPSIYQALQTT